MEKVLTFVSNVYVYRKQIGQSVQASRQTYLDLCQK